MGRVFEKSILLPDGRRVGYGLAQRGGTWYVRFIGPDNLRVKRSLGVEKKGDVQQRAEEVIAQEFRSLLLHQRVTWAEAEYRLRRKFASSGRRPSTLTQYLKDMELGAGLLPLR